MKIYVPVYDIGGWFVKEIDTEKEFNGKKQFRARKSTGYPVSLMYEGMIYDGDNCFITQDDAWKWIRKEYVPEENKIDVMSL